ncbi:MAG: hypothetical protein KAW12_13280 [Candidatus Aminicenantes bacterium]|nr:hypothetical protein [Candidatus Aminicenantes bacterium]
MKKRVNITIDQDLYDSVGAIAGHYNVSISEIIGQSLRSWLNKKKYRGGEPVLLAEDEKELSDILAKDDFVSSEEVKHILGL